MIKSIKVLYNTYGLTKEGEVIVSFIKTDLFQKLGELGWLFNSMELMAETPEFSTWEIEFTED